MRARTLLVGGAVVVSLGLLTGCGSAINGSPTAAGSSSQGGGAGAQLGDQVKTVADLSNLVGSNVDQVDTAQVKMVSSGNTTTGQVKFGNPVAIQMTINSAASGSTPAEQEQMLLVNNVFYMQIPGLSEETGKPWVKIDPSDSSNPMNALFGALLTSIQQNADPTVALKNLEAGGTLTGSDTEQLNGETTTHYKITVDIDKMIANQTNATMKQMLSLAQQKGMTNYPVEVWVNNKGLPVQMTINLPSLSGAGMQTGGVQTITYSNWGAPVTITPPPADQVGDFSDITGGGSTNGG